jgi:hypothetical protein
MLAPARSLACAVLACAALADPLPTSEFAVDAPVPGRMPGRQTRPAVGAASDTFLVVWEDRRRDGGYGVSDLYGARVSADGVPLDPWSIPIATDGLLHAEASVASDGTDFLVVWTRTTYDRGSYKTRAILGARIRADGTVLDPGGFPIAEGGSSPSIAYDGEQYLVTWTDADGSGIDGVWLSRDGAIDPASFDIVDAGQWEWAPAVGCRAVSSCLVAWISGRTNEVRAARVEHGRGVLDPGGLPIGATATNFGPSVATDGFGYLVAWADQVVPVAQDGSVSGAFDLTNAYGGVSRVQVAYDGQAFWVTWRELYEPQDEQSAWELFGRRLGSDAWPVGATLPLATSPTLSSNDYVAPLRSGVACAPPHCVAAWDVGVRECNVEADDILATRLEDGSVRDDPPVPVSLAGNDQRAPAVTTDGTNYLAVWEDWRDGVPHIWETTIRGDGSAVLPPAAASGGLGEDHTPAIAWNEAGRYVVSDDIRYYWDSYAAWCASTSSGPSHPTIAAAEAGYLVAYTQYDTSGNPHGSSWVTGQWRGNDGTSRWVGMPECEDYGYQSTAAVGSDGHGFLLLSTGCDYPRGLRFAGDGTAIDTWPIELPAAQSVAFDGQNYLVVGPKNGGIIGSRVGTDGRVKDPDGFVIAAGGTDTAVAFDGEKHVVVWRDRRSGRDDLYGARVDPEGHVLDVDGVRIAAIEDQGGPPAVASAGGGRSLCLYSKFDPDPEKGGYRLYGRFLEWERLAAGSRCRHGWECESGVCVDESCCDAACGSDAGSAEGPDGSPAPDGPVAQLAPDGPLLQDQPAAAGLPARYGCGCAIGDSTTQGPTCVLALGLVVLMRARSRARSARSFSRLGCRNPAEKV